MAGEFDPDAFLANEEAVAAPFDPDAFLAETAAPVPTAPLVDSDGIELANLAEVAPSEDTRWRMDQERKLAEDQAADAKRADDNAFIRAGFEGALQAPDDEGAIQKLATHFKVPTDAAATYKADLDIAYKAAKFDPETFQQQNPELARMLLRDRETNKTVHKDVKLSGLVKAFRFVQDKLQDYRGFVQTTLGGRPGALAEAAGLATNDTAELNRLEAIGPEAVAGEREARDAPKKGSFLDNPAATHIREHAPHLAPFGELSQNWEGLAIAELYSQIATRVLLGKEGQLLGQDVADLERQAIDRERLNRRLDLGEAGTFTDILTGGASTAFVMTPWKTGRGSLDFGIGVLMAPVAGFVASKPGGKVLVGAVIATSAFQLEQGSVMRESAEWRTDSNEALTKRERAAAATVYAAGATAIELGEFGILAGLGKTAGAFRMPGGKKAFGDAFRALTLRSPEFRGLLLKAGAALAGEPAEEGTQALFQSAITYFAKSLKQGELQAKGIGQAEAEDALEQAGAVMPFSVAQTAMAAAVGRLTGALDRDQNLTGNGQAEAIAGVKESPTVQAAPAAVARLIEDTTSKTGNPVTHMYVDAEVLGTTALFQSANAEEGQKESIEELLGPGGAKKLEDAIAIGGKVEIPMPLYLEKWAGTPTAVALAEHTTTRAAHLTPAQLAEDPKLIEEQTRLVVEEADRVAAQEAEADKLFTKLEADLSDAVVNVEGKQKRIGKGGAKKLASLYRNAYRAAAASYGHDAAAQHLDDARVAIANGEDLGAGMLQAGAPSLLEERALSEDPAQHARDLFIDPLTNARSFEGWNAEKRTPGKQVVALTVATIKPVNDSPKGGHDTANVILKHLSPIARAADPRAARKGTTFLLEGDAATLAATREAMSKALPEGMAIEGGIGANTDAAFAALDATVDAKRLVGELPAKRTETKFDLETLPALEQQLAATQAAEPELTPEMLAEAADATPEQKLAAYQDKKNPDVLNEIGFEHSGPKAWVVAFDVRGLKADFNEAFEVDGVKGSGKWAGDLAIAKVAEVAARIGGHSVDFAHLSGDEYAAKHDNKDAARNFALDLQAELLVDPVVIERNGEVRSIAVQLRFGLGAKTYGAADRALNTAKAGEQAGADSDNARRDEGARARKPGRVAARAERVLQRGARPAAFAGGSESGAREAGGDRLELTWFERDPRSPEEIATAREYVARMTKVPKREWAGKYLDFIIAGRKGKRPGRGGLSDEIRNEVRLALADAGFIDPEARWNNDQWEFPTTGIKTAKEAAKSHGGGNGGALWKAAHPDDYYNLTYAEQQRVDANQDPARGGTKGGSGRMFQDEKPPTLDEVLSGIEATTPGIELDVSEGAKSKFIEVGRIVVPENARGQGAGTRAMQAIADYADRVGKPIALTPSTEFGASSKARLVRFYRSLGFVENKGRNKDFETRERMIRPPRTDSGELHQLPTPEESIKQMKALVVFLDAMREKGAKPVETYGTEDLNLVEELARKREYIETPQEPIGPDWQPLPSVLLERDMRRARKTDANNANFNAGERQTLLDTEQAMTKLGDKARAKNRVAGNSDAAIPPSKNLPGQAELEALLVAMNLDPRRLFQFPSPAESYARLKEDVVLKDLFLQNGVEVTDAEVAQILKRKEAYVTEDQQPRRDPEAREGRREFERQFELSEGADGRRLAFVTLDGKETYPPHALRTARESNDLERDDLALPSAETDFSTTEKDTRLLEGAGTRRRLVNIRRTLIETAPNKESRPPAAGKIPGREADEAVQAKQTARDLDTLLKQAQLDTARELFAGDPKNPRGSVRHVRQGLRDVFMIALNPNADLSTFLHESGHVFLELLTDLGQRADATPQAKADLEAVLKWFGINDPATITRNEQGWSFTREQHEKFADGFLVYLREGKSPSPALAKAFKAFSDWLKAVYKSVAQLGVELNPEIRGVFDRLLATDDEIDAMRRQMGKPLFGSLAEALAAGLSPEKYADWLEDQALANSSAERAAKLRIRKEELRKKDKQWKADLEVEVTAAEAEYEALPARKAQLILAGKGTDEYLGLDMALDRAAVEAAVGEAAAKKFRLAKEGGVNPDELAPDLGFETGAEMLKAVEVLPPKDVWAKKRAEWQMSEKNPGVLEDREQLRELVGKGLHGDDNERSLLKEIEALTAKAPDGSRPVEAIQYAAKQMVERLEVGHLNASRALQAERKAANLAVKALAKGNFGEVLVQKHRQLLAMYMYRELQKAREERQAFVDLAQDLRKTKSRQAMGKASPVLRDGVDFLLEAFGLKEVAPTTADLAAVVKVLEDQAASKVSLQELQDLVAKRGAGDWTNLTLAKMRILSNALKNIQGTARFMNTVILDEKRASKAEVVAETLAAIDKALIKKPAGYGTTGSSNTVLEDLGGLYNSVTGSLLRPNTMLQDLADGDTDSIIQRAFIDPLRKAKHVEADLAADVAAPIIEAFEAVPKEVRARFREELPKNLFPNHSDKARPPRYRYELLMMLLNAGNEGNLSRLLGGVVVNPDGSQTVLGRNITLEELTEALNLLTKEELDWAQSVLDAHEAPRQLRGETEARSLKDRAFDQEERDTGIRPEAVRPRPLVLKNGTLRGGYFPAVYDRSAEQVGERQAAQALADLFDPSYTRPGTSTGHLKARVPDFIGIISLEPATIYSHLGKQIHDVAFRDAVKSVGSLVLDPEIDAALKRYLGDGKARQFLKWMKDIGSSNGMLDNSMQGLEKVTQFVRGNMGPAILGWKLTTALGDIGNFPAAVAATPLKAKYLAAGVSAFLNGRTQARKVALELSGELRFQQDTLQRDFQRNVKSLTSRWRHMKLLGPLAWWKDHSFAFLEATQAATATPIWIGAYRQAIDEGRDTEAAAKWADNIINQVFPSHSAVDQSGILRDKKFWGLSVLFYGYMNTAYNMQHAIARPLFNREFAEASAGDKAKTVAKVSGAMLGLYLSVGALSELFAGRGPEEGDDDDEPSDDPLARNLARKRNWLMRKTVVAPLSLLPFGAHRGVEAWWLDKRQAGTSGTLVDSYAAALGSGVLDTFAGDSEVEKKLLATTKVLGLTMGLGTSPIGTTGKYVFDALNGAEEQSPADVASGLVYGRRENQPENPITFFTGQ